jgi:hypothetical protein
MIPNNNLPPIHPGEFLKEILDELRAVGIVLSKQIVVCPGAFKNDRILFKPLTLPMAKARGFSGNTGQCRC